MKKKLKNKDRVNCKKHGYTGVVNFLYDEVSVKKCCFKCYVEKTTKGLKDFNVN